MTEKRAPETLPEYLKAYLEKKGLGERFYLDVSACDDTGHENALVISNKVFQKGKNEYMLLIFTVNNVDNSYTVTQYGEKSLIFNKTSSLADEGEDFLGLILERLAEKKTSSPTPDLSRLSSHHLRRGG